MSGEFDSEELAREAERARLLYALSVEPVVTLNHYTHPLWFWKEGGWESAKSVERFARLAGVVAEALPQVRFWVTLNEPIVFILGGYLGGLIPPGQRRFSSAAAALENLLRAHVAASAAIRERIPAARVGMAHNMLAFAPDRPDSALDKKLVAAGEALYNDALVEASRDGQDAVGVSGRRKHGVSRPRSSFVDGVLRAELLQPCPPALSGSSRTRR